MNVLHSASRYKLLKLLHNVENPKVNILQPNQLHKIPIWLHDSSLNLLRQDPRIHVSNLFDRPKNLIQFNILPPNTPEHIPANYLFASLHPQPPGHQVSIGFIWI